MIQRQHILNVFDDHLLFELEQHVIHMPEQPKLFGGGREFSRYISLPRTLEDVARGSLRGARRIEFDLATDEILFHF